jgi:hypothetical protein
MTVGELIEKLQSLDKDALVKMEQEMDSSGGWVDIAYVTQERFGDSTYVSLEIKYE